MAFSLFHQKKLKSQRGFTLIELIVVIAIIAILSILIGFSIIEMIKRGKVAKAQGDLNKIAKAILQLEIDTGLYPAKDPGNGCGILSGVDNEIDVFPGATRFNNSGLMTNFLVPVNTWKGPYLEDISKDPWGNFYMYDGDYECKAGVKGCEDYIGGGTDEKAVQSRGPNGTQYDSDDIVIIFCTR
jgi:general secretion pathway protein G